MGCAIGLRVGASALAGRQVRVIVLAEAEECQLIEVVGRLGEVLVVAEERVQTELAEVLAEAVLPVADLATEVAATAEAAHTASAAAAVAAHKDSAVATGTGWERHFSVAA